jgi:saccharopepsin
VDRVSVPQQAFLDSSSAQNPALSYDADGILGLGFTSLSTIDALVNMTNSSTGRSLLYNLFLDNPKEPNFIAFSLERTSDQNDSADGTFSVGRWLEPLVYDSAGFHMVSICTGQYDPQYQRIANTAAIPTFPETSPKRWSVLVDSIVVGSTQVPVTTSVANAPGNKAVALLDSGTSYSFVPTIIFISFSIIDVLHTDMLLPRCARQYTVV